jgi:hypothetical protein
MDTTYDVTVWAIYVYEGKRGKTYYVRWKVGNRRFNESFKTRALADSFRSDLVTATRKGEPFDLSTGRPVSALRTDVETTWFSFAADYAEIKWRAASPEHRRGIAEALTNITMALLLPNRCKPESELLRQACKVTFSLNLRGTATNDEASDATQWLTQHTTPVSKLAEPDVLRSVMTAIGSKLDGTAAATSTVRRKRMTLRNALDFAVERDLLRTNPITDVKQSAKVKAPGLRQVDAAGGCGRPDTERASPGRLLRPYVLRRSTAGGGSSTRETPPVAASDELERKGPEVGTCEGPGRMG